MEDGAVVTAAQTLPLAVFVLVGGVWADRLPRQWVLISGIGAGWALASTP